MSAQTSSIAAATAGVVQLSAEEITSITNALDYFKSQELDGDAVNTKTFPLMNLESRLAQVTDAINKGNGFAIVRGLGEQKQSAEDQTLVFLGLASNIGGDRGIQNGQGDMLVHVTDSANWDHVPREKRHGIHGNSSLSFHSDMGTDILALQVREVASNGGATHVASAAKIYQELKETHPEVIETLKQAAWPIQVSGNAAQYILAPLLMVHEDQVIISMDAGRLGLHPATAASAERENIPDLTTVQKEALGILKEVATKHAVKLDLQKGDILFINNLTTLHARDAFDETDKSAVRRHYVRLWLSNPQNTFNLPEAMKVPRDAAFGYLEHEKQGKTVNHRGKFIEPRYSVDAPKEYSVPKYTAGSAAFVLEDEELFQGDWKKELA